MNLILLILAGIFVNNYVLSQFLGICPFLGVSKKVETAAGMGVAGVGAVASTGGSATAGDVSCTDLPQDMQNFAPSVNCAPQYMQYLIMHSISPLRSDTTITAHTGCGRRTNDAGTWGYRIKRTSRPGPNGTKVAAVQRHCTTRTRSSSRIRP